MQTNLRDPVSNVRFFGPPGALSDCSLDLQPLRNSLGKTKKAGDINPRLFPLTTLSREFRGLESSAFLVGEGEADLPRQAARPAADAGDVDGEVHVGAADRRAAEQARVDSLADDVLRAAVRTAERLGLRGDGHDDALGFDPFTVGDFVAADSPDVVQHPVGHARSPV